MTAFLTLDDIDVSGARVLVRSDLNVPLDEGRVADDFRIRSSLPTIARLREAGAVVTVASHLGRPDGRDPSLSMAPIGERLGELGGFPVIALSAVAGEEVTAAVAAAAPGDVLLLENTRYEPGEKKNDPALAAALGELGDFFVLDAFGTAHRAHASTVGVTEHVKSVAGPLLAQEVEALDALLRAPARPYVVVLGGAKVSDKLGVMKALLPRVDVMLVGGGMCFTLLAAEGYDVGDSLLEEDMIDEVRDLLESEWGSRVTLPSDIVVADRFAEDASAEVVAATQMESGMGLDIGPDTAALFSSVISGAGSVFWNGPMGVFEWESFRAGTETVARAFASSSAFTVAGGGDSVAALRSFGLDDQISHLSTGGGAGLEFLEGDPLPGLVALERWTHES
ncbi:MAG: phosphoglycerate kinase [Acidimicrobiia bacterium]|nr:phosphoglycerate kinase [Acidimicrobiia bacterium]MBT8192357.1 phosphoglycerate kinase [Acidimicrobiia bacterium]NNF88062.1 phosphoglycerate kinase [Acidimicrobiia bacterium]NNJ47013.1 phosphoglycerate kinase [Acidimicrobiia bacterium]NNL96754.1 phosphoglycerate kinase [Acidimicrobiia bacterium]